MSKYGFIQVNTFNCGGCGNSITEGKFYNNDGWCNKCIVIDVLDDTLKNTSTDDGESNLSDRIADLILSTDKRGLNEILADVEENQVFNKIWEILNKFNPNNPELDITLTSDEWDEICTEMAWIKEDLN